MTCSFRQFEKRRAGWCAGGCGTVDYLTSHSVVLTQDLLSSMSVTLRPVGGMLREWRQRRRLSQLDLACEAEISQRHLSFVESGRAAPSREMLLHLGALSTYRCASKMSCCWLADLHRPSNSAGSTTPNCEPLGRRWSSC